MDLNGTGPCTTGFTVRNSADVGGVLTAGHCNVNRYIHPEDGSTVTMNFQARHEGQYGDVGWYATPEIEGEKFYISNTGTRSVLTVACNACFSQNEWIFYYGRVTGFGSAQVKFSSIQCDDIDRLVEMKTHPTKDGDSGAPWFVDNEANGVHAGWCYEDQILRNTKLSVFSKASRVDEALGVTIKLDLG